MAIGNIEEKLNKQFAANTSNSRKLIFWYDDKGTYEEEIDNIHLADGEILKLRKDNGFEAKYTLCRKFPEKNYLIYAPFPKPPDSDELNFMLDLYLIAEPFYADAIADLCQELKIDLQYKPLLEKQKDFWKKRANVIKFQKLELVKYSRESISLGVMAAICNLKVVKLDEIVKKLIFEDDLGDENKYLLAFKTANVLEDFWRACEDEYGFDSSKTLTRLILTFVYSYIEGCNGAISKEYPDAESLSLTTSANVFMANLLTNFALADDVDILLEKISNKLDFKSIISRENIEDYYKCDVFKIIDEKIIDHLCRVLIASGRALTDFERNMLRERFTTMHYSKSYQKDYKAVKYADLFIQAVKKFSLDIGASMTAEELYNQYTISWYNIDVYYRKFYCYYDVSIRKEMLAELMEQVESSYVNVFWAKLAEKWSPNVKSCQEYRELPGFKQEDFYDSYVSPRAGEMTAVIISDALRYEVGQELVSHINDDANMKAEIKPMVAGLPSVTSVGMASLLPHKNMEFKDDLAVVVDAKATNTTAARCKILKDRYAPSLAMAAVEIKGLLRDELRAKLENVKTLYVYHNTIDKAGEHLEEKVLSAADEAIADILDIIRKLGYDKSIVKFIVTADHGFIYRRSKLSAIDKISFPKESVVVTDKRFMITDKECDIHGTVSMNLEQWHKGWKIHVPYGYDIFSTQGGGMQYQHGGASLQELVVPVVEVSFERYKVKKNKVDVELYTAINKITSFISYLDFLQDEKVTDTRLSRTVQCWIEDGEGNKISNTVIIVADRKMEDPKDRIYTEKFVLPTKKYSSIDKYYLVIGEGDDILQKYPMIIDIIYKGIEL